MHNLGATKNLKSLPVTATFRLGLSATPVRRGDEQGTKALEDYFGPEAIRFELKDAIENGFLCPYDYFPILVQLTDDEMEAYLELSIQIANIWGSDHDADNGPSDKLKWLLLERARLIGGAENKFHELLPIISQDPDKAYNLVYCSDAKDPQTEERQVERAVRIISTEAHMRANKFTAGESPKQRKELLSDFEAGRLQVLVAIRCLDEGVDVPRTETAYILASSTNPRQFIQRRGRVLRRANGKTKATIYDFVTVPDLDDIRHQGNNVFNIERGMVARELERVNEFANLSLNKGESLRRLREIRQKLNLMDM